MRQDVEEKATDEFLRRKGHRFLLAVVPIVLVSEAHLIGFDVHQSVVRDRDAMGVAADIIQDLFGAGEGPLGIDDPLCFFGSAQESGEVCILRGFLESDEFGARGGQPLCFQ